ncbi:MAG: hypothetical protein JNG84_08420 [Archangium sp.]|nr:hypothetical protein [Archangium sp.]
MGTNHFTKEMVERTIKYFGDPKAADEKDPKAMKALIADYVKFEQVVERGMVTPDAKPLANDFLVFAKDWIRKNKLEKVYTDLKK